MDTASCYTEVQTVASRRTRGPADNISFGALVWPVTNRGVPNITSVQNSVNDIWRVVPMSGSSWRVSR